MNQNQLDFYLADAFSPAPFSGAQIGVFPETGALDDAAMQKLAAELNLPQTLFLQPGGTEATWRARIFNPQREMNFAAQAIIAGAYVLDHIGAAGDGSPLSLATHRGVLPLHFIREGGHLQLATFAMTVEPIVDPFTPPVEELARLLGLPSSAIETRRHAPKVAACGRPFLIIPLQHKDLVRQARFDFKAWSESSAPMTAAQEILLFSPGSHTPEADFHARLVGPEIGPKEDPPVGAAMPAFCAYLCSHSHIRRGTYTFAVERGADDARRSLLHLEMDHRGKERLSLRIGGQAVVVAEGRIRIP